MKTPGKELFYMTKHHMEGMTTIMTLRADFTERDTRYRNLRASMEKAGLEAIIVGGSGGLVQSWNRVY